MLSNFNLRAFECFRKSFGNLKGSYRLSSHQQYQATALNWLSHPSWNWPTSQNFPPTHSRLGAVHTATGHTARPSLPTEAAIAAPGFAPHPTPHLARGQR
jgi:hypothetical protein